MLPEFSQPTDRFVLEARVGSGGMGDIFRAFDRETSTIVAVKTLRSSANEHEKIRFAREIQTIAELRHPNIVQYIAHGTLPDGQPFYAMEWLDGEDLGQRQRRAPLGMRDAVEVVRRSSAAMAAIHSRGIVHRDLKLSNIYLVRGKGTAAKLIDFGVVKPSGPDDFPTQKGTIIGTPHFMAPEQARGEIIDARADVYSLGSVLFRLVCGRNVFETDHVIALLGRLVLEDPPRAQSIRFDVPDALDQVIAKALARKREDRYENGGDLARALARVGELPNDPPATDRSASAVRRAVPEINKNTITGTGAGPAPARPGTIERRVVACALFDLGGESLGPETAAALRGVLGEDTRLEPLVGDQLVAVLGVERSKGDEALRAARAALTVVEAVPSARAGVAVGYAFRGRGNMAGEALDRAARQIDVATPGQARVDGYAAIGLHGRFIVQDDAHGGILVREDATGFGTRQLLGKVTPTLGRDAEIERLAREYDQLLADPSPRAVVVTGVAGIGKSRVRGELVQRLEGAARTPELMVCRGDPLSQASSLTALGRGLRAAMGLHDGVAYAEQVQKVKGHVGARLPRTLRFLAAFLGELAGVPFPDETDEALRAARASPQLMQSRLRMALEAYLRARADQAPQVLVLEDAHWADDTTLDLVDWLLGCQDLKFCVYAFARPELFTRAPSLWAARRAERLVLGPLGDDAARRLVEVALPSAPHAVRDGIAQRAGGNALFLEELVRCAAEGRTELPPTVQALVQLRLDRMAPKVREVLRAASVFGQTFWQKGVMQLVEHSARNELDELLKAEIVTKQPQSRIANTEEFMFRQALVRDAAYASILDEDRAEMHASAGSWLEAAGATDEGLLALHAEAGGDRAHAGELYARATRQAISQGASLDVPLELAERGLACGVEGEARAQLLVAKALACLNMGRLGEAVVAGSEATPLVAPPSDLWVEAQRIVVLALADGGRGPDAEARAAWALGPELRRVLGPAQIAPLLAARARALVVIGQGRLALGVADEALAAARAANTLPALLRAQEARVTAAAHLGDVSEVVAAGSALLESADAASDVVIATRTRVSVAAALNALGAFEQATVLLERALLDARTRRLRILEASAMLQLGVAHARLGDADEAVEVLRAASNIADECGATRQRVQGRLYEALALVWRGGPGDLGAALALAGTAAAETAGSPLRAAALGALARVQLARRQPMPALAAAREANALLAQAPVEELEELVRLSLVEALLAAGQAPEADEQLDRAFRSLVERVRAVRKPEHRASFVARNEEVAALAELARARLGRTLPLL